jgi:hypothetical protein
MDHGRQAPAHEYGHAKLFHYFTRERAFGRFAGVYFPAGKFPEARMLPRGGPFSQQYFSPAFYDRAYYINEIFCHSNPI